MSTIDKDLLTDLESTWKGALQPLADRIDEETKKFGEGLGETKSSIDQVQDRLDEIEAQMKKAALDSLRVTAGELEKHVKSFWHFHTKGEPVDPQRHQQFVDAFWQWTRQGDSLPSDIRGSLIVGDDTQAGYLAPPEFVAEMLKGIVEWSPIREIVRVITTGAPSVRFPKRTGTFAARWVGETQARTETTGLTVGVEEIPVHEIYAMVDVGNQLLEDSLFDLEAWIMEEASEQFGVAEGGAFVNGDGVGKPEGFLQHTGVTGITSATNDVLAADDVIKLYYEPKTAYARNGTWVLNRSTIRTVRLMKGSDNNYLWQAGLADAAPATILGAPYVEAPDMPSVGDGTKPIAFGDFRRGYMAVDRIQTQMQRDPYTMADDGLTRFRVRRRQGGQVVVPEAIKTITIA